MAEIYALGLDFMQYNNSVLLRALAEQGQPSLCCLTAGCFSISQLPHGNAYLIGKEKRSWIEYFFAAAANILLGVTRLFYMKCGDGTEILQDFRICTSKKAAITKKVYR